MSDQAPSESPPRGTGEGTQPDTSLRNFVIGVLAVSAVIIALAYVLQNAAG